MPECQVAPDGFRVVPGARLFSIFVLMGTFHSAHYEVTSNALLVLLFIAVKIPDSVKAELVVELAEIEHRMSFGASEKLQLGAMCAAFSSVRRALEKLQD